MKRSMLAVILFVFSFAAFAVNLPGDACAPKGVVSSTSDGVVLTCDGAKFSKIVEIKIGLSGSVMEGGKVLHAFDIVAIDGKQSAVIIGREHSYTSGVTNDGGKKTFQTSVLTDGLNMVVTPTILSNGMISADVKLTESTLNGMRMFEHGGDKIQLPELGVVEIQQVFLMKSGEEVHIPFGSAVSVGGTWQPQYTLHITALKI